MNVSRLFINPDILESVKFLSRFSVASYGFSRLVTNELGYLDGHYFVIGTIKEVMDEPDWWYYSCVCGHAVVEHEDLYLCDACGSCIEHVMVKYRIRVKIHHGGCAVLFVLLDNAAIKLFGKTCFEAFLRIEEEFPVDPNVRRSYSPHMFDDVVGEEKIFKVEINSAVDRDYSGCFKFVNVFSHNSEPAATDDYINARLHGPIFPPIYDTYLQYATREDYKTQVVCDNSIQSETIEDIITDLISPNRCYSDAENGSYCKLVPLKLISSLLHKKVVFMVDARPVGYEMNRFVYIVQQIWDDASVINFLRLMLRLRSIRFMFWLILCLKLKMLAANVEAIMSAWVIPCPSSFIHVMLFLATMGCSPFASLPLWHNSLRRSLHRRKNRSRLGFRFSLFLSGVG
ncbi:hypothetical protein Ahy_B03g065373 [Arachis hypogaea]|uniref:Replication factor A C-terminal domain-containing protein n=1 Tax=Arachis hypogaea TaxID=3818 RepID=A0A445A1H4_ARAHY|nr:hypothetical protein Ahy_B03g065373 [Arachis hypogaea]